MEKYEVKKSKSNIFLTLIQIILIICLIWSGVHIINWLRENKGNSEVLEKVQNAVSIVEGNTIEKDIVDENIEEKPLDANDYDVDFDSLRQTNHDIVAWLKVNNTNIAYPVVKANDNSYYLTHSFDKSYNTAGWTFADYRNKFNGTDKNIIIYGHNRKDNSMFATLHNAFNVEWLDNPNNRIVVLITENGKYNYEIFSFYQVPNEEYYITTSFSNASYKEYIKNMKARSIHDFGTTVTEDDTILTLSTCGESNVNRVVLHAKMIKD